MSCPKATELSPITYPSFFLETSFKKLHLEISFLILEWLQTHPIWQ
jgi:hypothetical protein